MILFDRIYIMMLPSLSHIVIITNESTVSLTYWLKTIDANKLLQVVRDRVVRVNLIQIDCPAHYVVLEEVLALQIFSSLHAKYRSLLFTVHNPYLCLRVLAKRFVIRVCDSLKYSTADLRVCWRYSLLIPNSTGRDCCIKTGLTILLSKIRYCAFNEESKCTSSVG